MGTFNKLDVNGDGELSKEDFWQLANDFFFTDDLTLPGNWLLGFYERSQETQKALNLANKLKLKL